MVGSVSALEDAALCQPNVPVCFLEHALHTGFPPAGSSALLAGLLLPELYILGPAGGAWQLG